jgi:phospholipid-binding lipoprotein MlaA
MMSFSLSAHADIEEYEAYVQEIREAEKFKDSISYSDPYENFNRSMFSFNLAFHENIGSPVVEVYKKTPSPIQTAVSNFFDNLSEPLSFTNSFLQGNLKDGLEGLMRFTINTTFGLIGILDVATEAGLTSKNEDFGQTLQVWGFWQESHYLVLPLLGPTTTRGFFGSRIDDLYDPYYNQWSNLDENEEILTKGMDGFESYSKAAPIIDQLKYQSDPYLFARDSYIQYRNNQIYNGKAPLKPLDDFLF